MYVSQCYVLTTVRRKSDAVGTLRVQPHRWTRITFGSITFPMGQSGIGPQIREIHGQ